MIKQRLDSDSRRCNSALVKSYIIKHQVYSVDINLSLKSASFKNKSPDV